MQNIEIIEYIKSADDISFSIKMHVKEIEPIQKFLSKPKHIQISDKLIRNSPQQLPFLNIEFTREDINKLIFELFRKGTRFLQLRASRGKDCAGLLKKLMESIYVQIMVRKVVQKMGDERRLGNHLRGLSRLFMEQIEKYIWGTVEIELKLNELNVKASVVESQIEKAVQQ